jgi:fatty-acid peroxygenase
MFRFAGRNRSLPGLFRQLPSASITMPAKPRPDSPQKRAPKTVERRSATPGARLAPRLALGAAGLAAAALVNRWAARASEGRHPPRGRFVRVNGVRLHYLESGSGPPLVLLHGNAVTAEDFVVSGLLDALAAEHRVIAFDRPGYGYSERPRGAPWTARAQARLLLAALEQLGVDRFVVAGHSWGAFVAAQMALERPDSARGLVLISGYLRPTLRPDAAAISLPAAPLLGDLLRWTAAPWVSALMAPAILRRVFAPAPVPERFRRDFPIALSLRPGQIRASAAEAALLGAEAVGLRKRLARLGAPVMIIVGRDDRLVSARHHSQWLARRLAGAELLVIEGAGHMVHHSAATEVTRAMLGFCDPSALELRRRQPGLPIPSTGAGDHTLALLREGYRFLPERFRRLGTDIFSTRLMLSKVTCVKGEEGARLLYQGDRFTRVGAIPPTTLLSLQDKGSVLTLDGPAHRWRKRMFLELLGPEQVVRLGDRFEALWRERLDDWAAMDQVVLFPEVTELICRAVCDWAGVPLSTGEARQRARAFAAMIDGAGAVGPRNWRGLWLRSRTERWARELIRRTRSGALTPPAESALAVIAAHRGRGGRRLPIRMATVELLNILRPTVASGRFIAFAALALLEHPQWRERLATAGPAERIAFAQEVRRLYPFFPAAAGRARSELIWRGRRFRKGAWVMLDICGTNTDPRSWREPEAFRPERFLDGEAGAFNFVPQGGGGPTSSHRCPGEGMTLELMQRALKLLTSAMHWQAPPQDLTVDLARFPTAPASGVIIAEVTPAA